MADNSQCDWSIITKKNMLDVKRQLKDEISQLKQEIKTQKLTKTENKEKKEYQEELYWMSMCEGSNEQEERALEKEYVKYLNLMLRKQTGKSNVNYLRLVELERMLSELTALNIDYYEDRESLGYFANVLCAILTTYLHK